MSKITPNYVKLSGALPIYVSGSYLAGPARSSFFFLVDLGPLHEIAVSAFPEGGGGGGGHSVYKQRIESDKKNTGVRTTQMVSVISDVWRYGERSREILERLYLVTLIPYET